jgi:peptidyl-tRNA hydrolase
MPKVKRCRSQLRHHLQLERRGLIRPCLPSDSSSGLATPAGNTKALGITPVPFLCAARRAIWPVLATDRNALGEWRGVIAGHDLRLLIPRNVHERERQIRRSHAQLLPYSPDAILIAHDELDIPPGEARFKYDGGHGGHNGLRDIIPALGGHRISGGCALASAIPAQPKKVSSWVLSKASAEDQTAIEASIDVSHSAYHFCLTVRRSRP